MARNLFQLLSTRHRSEFDRVLTVQGNGGRQYFSRTRDQFVRPQEIADTGIFYSGAHPSKTIMAICAKAVEAFGYSANDLDLLTDERQA